MALIDLTSPSLLQSGVDLFYGAIDFRSKDNAADNPTHNPIEFAAREAAEWISYYKQLNSVGKYLISGVTTSQTNISSNTSTLSGINTSLIGLNTYASGVNSQVISIQNAQTAVNATLSNSISGVNTLAILDQSNINLVTSYASGTKTLVNTLQIDLTANNNTTSGINTTLIGLNTYASGIETLRRAMVVGGDTTAVTTYASGINTQVISFQNAQTAVNATLSNSISGVNTLAVGNQSNITNITSYASGTKTLVNTLQTDLTANSNTTSGINTTLIGLNTYASGIETLRRAMISQSDHLDTQNITWTNLINTTVLGNTLTKTAGVNGAWDSGAVSTQMLNSGDGYAEYTVPNTAQYVMFGLSNGDTGGSYEEIDFATYTRADTGVLYAVENGAFIVIGSYVEGDVLRVAVEGGAVKYRQNGTLLYTSLVSPTYPLIVDTSLYSTGAYISGAIFDTYEIDNTCRNYTSGVNTLAILDQSNINLVTSYASGTKTLVNTLQINQTSINSTLSGVITDIIEIETYASGVQSIAVNHKHSGAGTNSVALGSSAIANNDGATAIGYDAQATGWGYSVAIGPSSRCGAGLGVAIGSQANANGSNGTAIGDRASASGAYSFVLGNGATASATNSVAIGGHTNVNAASLCRLENSCSIPKLHVVRKDTRAELFNTSSIYTTVYASAPSVLFTNELDVTQVALVNGSANWTIAVSGNVVTVDTITPHKFSVGQYFSTDADWTANPFMANLTDKLILSMPSDSGSTTFTFALTQANQGAVTETNAGAGITPGDYVIDMPSGGTFFVDEIGVIASSGTVFTTQPTIQFGNSGDRDAFYAPAITTRLTALCTREVLTPIAVYAGQTSLSAGMTVAGAGTNYKIRFYWRGIFVEDE